MAEWRRRTATVRFRVTVLATVAVALMLTVTCGGGWSSTRGDVLTEGLDEALALEAESLGSRAGEGQTELDRVIDDEGVVQIVSNGAVIASTGNLQGRATIAPTPTRRSEVRTINEVLAGEPPFRVASRQITIDGRPATIHVGAPLDDVNETTASLPPLPLAGRRAGRLRGGGGAGVDARGPHTGTGRGDPHRGRGNRGRRSSPAGPRARVPTTKSVGWHAP